MEQAHFVRTRPLRVGGIAMSFVLALAVPRLAFAQEAEDASDAAEAAEADADAAQAERAADAELAAEEARAAQAVQKPPPKGKGVVWGAVTDTKFGEAVIEAQVQVIGRKERALSDVEGRFRLELPPGKYRLRIVYELHQPARVDEVVVQLGQMQRIDVKLVPDEGAIEEVLIEEEVDNTSTEGQALTRKNSAVVGDGVGRAEIARTPDKNAAEAAQRVVGATIVDGRFVYVRGLGERYSNALLNGAPLPSPEPDRNTVPLDLFPSLVLDSLNIVKQFTPDMPGDFAGGSVRIQTRDFPKQRLFQLSLSGGYNTEGTFKKRLTDYQSRTDWLGFDNGRRQLPGDIPSRKLDSSNPSKEEQQQYGRRLNTPMGTLRKLTPPNHGITLVAGDSTKLNANTKLGSLLALTYGHSYQRQDVTLRRFRAGGGGEDSPQLLVGDEFSGTKSVDTVRWGAFGSVALESSRNTTVGFTGLHSQSADNTVFDLEGSLGGTPTTRVHANHLEYVSRSLNFGQLRGQHRFPRQGELEIDWHASLAAADRTQPDTRDVRYRREQRDGVDGWLFSPDSSGQHQFLEQADRTLAVGLDVLQPLNRVKDHEIKLKAGTLITSRDRRFSARRFQFGPDLVLGSNYADGEFCPGSTWQRACPGNLFRPELVMAEALVLDEWTLDLDKYKTGLDVYGVYAMLDAQLLAKLRAIGGVRGEVTYQVFTGSNPFDSNAAPTQSNIYQTHWLPALSLVYAATPKTNLRAGISRTVARPQLRELSPALFTSSAGDLNLQGNPRLEITQIVNGDLRFEYFPTLKQVLAASVFYKHFKSPIEEIISANGTQGFANADKADLVGVELEGRVGLDILSSALKPFTGIANLTLVTSEVQLGSRKGAVTNDNRPLGNQSPYVVNLQLDYANEPLGTDFRVLYNVYGPRIVVVGALSLPDIYELPRHQVDVAVSKKLGKHFELKLQAQNLLFAPVVFAYRNQPAYRQDTTTTPNTFTSLGRNPETRRFQPGATFNLQASYTY